MKEIQMKEIKAIIDLLNDLLEAPLPEDASVLQVKKAIIDELNDIGRPGDNSCDGLVDIAVLWATMNCARIMGAEEYILNSDIYDPTHWTYGSPRMDYAVMIMSKRWSALEKKLLSESSPYDCYVYAKEILQARWLKAEPIIFTKCDELGDSWSEEYIEELEVSTFPSISSKMAKDPEMLVCIARHLGRRWPAAEQYIKKADEDDQDKYLEMVRELEEDARQEEIRLRQKEEERKAHEALLKKQAREKREKRKKLWMELA